MRKTYTLILMLAMMFSSNAWGAWGEDVTIGDFVYNFDGKKARISAYNGNATSLTFGDVEYEGVTYKVTEIASEVFKNNTTLENVTWQAYLTEGTTNIYYHIRAGAFEGCTNLKTFVTDNSQRMYLYSRAFKNCSSLTQFGGTANSVLLRSNVTGAAEVFSGCTSITKVTCMFIQTNVGKEYFKDCTGLNSVAFASLQNIGESAFEGCLSIPNINFRTTSTYTWSVTIGKNAFKNCTSATYVYTHQEKRAISEIGEGAFEGCSNLASVRAWYYNATENLYVETDLTGITTIGVNAFKGCALLTRYGRTSNVAIFPDDLAEIGASAFEGCSSLATIRLYKMDAAPTLGEDAFTGIKTDAKFYIYPTNSYTAAGKYANNDGWKVWFDGTKASYPLYAYVNKSNQYGTVSCDVPLTFAFASTPNLYKVTATDDAHSYLVPVSSRKLPANTGAVIEVGDNSGSLYTSQTVRVLFDGSESSADFSSNILVANVTENPNFKGQEGDTYNLLLSNGKFVKAIDGTLAAGLAYLPRVFSEGGEAKELTISFDEPTGIRTIDNVENTVDNDAWYTVNGVRLQGEPATKGVYIHNGKKIVIK